MIYSIMYSIIENLSLDKLHDQNVCSCAILFTKKKPTKILDFVNKDLNRGATWWKGVGDGTKTTTYITYLILSRYELHKLEKFIKVNKEDVFMVKNDYIGSEKQYEYKDVKINDIEGKMIDEERDDGTIHHYFINKDGNTFIVDFISQNDIKDFENKVLDSISF